MDSGKAHIIIYLVYAFLLVGLSVLHYFLVTRNVSFEEVSFPVSTHTVTATFALPETYNTSVQLPGVLVFHGFVASKEWMVHLTRQLALAGFAVLSIDQHGHGANSGGKADDDVTNETISLNGEDAVGAIEYLAARPEVDASFIGAAGWSMGASTVLSLNKAFTLSLTPIKLSASVLIGNLVRCDEADFDSTFPENVLNVIGRNDELFDLDEAIQLFEECILGVQAQEGDFYGNFSDGTARQILFTSSDHVFEAVEPAIIDRTVNWMLAASSNIPDINLLPTLTVQSLNLEFMSSIIAFLWGSFFILYFEFLRTDPKDMESIVPINKVDETGISIKQGDLHQRWWWVRHNLLAVAAIFFAFIIEFLTGELCVSFGVTLGGWGFFLGVVFALSILSKKGSAYLKLITKEAWKNKFAFLETRRDGAYNFFLAFLRSPIGLSLVFLAWMGVIQAIMASVPYTYGLAVPLFKGLEGSGPRRFILFLILWLLFFVGYYYELQIIILRITADFSLRNVVEIILARIWLFLVFILLIFIIVFAAQLRIFGSFGFYTLFIYPLFWDFSLLSILQQFGRSRGQTITNLALLSGGLTSFLISQILPFSGCG